MNEPHPRRVPRIREDAETSRSLAAGAPILYGFDQGPAGRSTLHWAAYTAPYNCRSRDERFAGTPPVAGLPDAVDAIANQHRSTGQPAVRRQLVNALRET